MPALNLGEYPGEVAPKPVASSRATEPSAAPGLGAGMCLYWHGTMP